MLLCFKLNSCFENLPLYENFGQENEFQRYVVEEDETIYIYLNDYFRGNFLNFTVNPTNQSREIVESKAIQIWTPMQLKNQYMLRDSL